MSLHASDFSVSLDLQSNLIRLTAMADRQGNQYIQPLLEQIKAGQANDFIKKNYIDLFEKSCSFLLNPQRGISITREFRRLKILAPIYLEYIKYNNRESFSNEAVACAYIFEKRNIPKNILQRLYHDNRYVAELLGALASSYNQDPDLLASREKVFDESPQHFLILYLKLFPTLRDSQTDHFLFDKLEKKTEILSSLDKEAIQFLCSRYITCLFEWNHELLNDKFINEIYSSRLYPTMALYLKGFLLQITTTSSGTTSMIFIQREKQYFNQPLIIKYLKL